MYGDAAENHAGELAHHFGESQTSNGVTKLVRYSRLAGERALASHAYEDAITHFERSLVARDITLSGRRLLRMKRPRPCCSDWREPSPPHSKKANSCEQLMEAFATLSRAFEYYFEYYVDAGNVAQAVAAAEFPIAPPIYPMPGVAQLMARALTLVPADSREAGRLLSRYGGVLGGAEADYEGAQQALGRAAAIARRVGDVPLETRTLAYACAANAHHLHWQESVGNGLRAIELTTGGEYTYSEFLSRFWTTVSLLSMGDLVAARRHALVLRDLADRRSTPQQHIDGILIPNPPKDDFGDSP